MRESHNFGERTSAKKGSEVKRKYLLVFEGTKTEPLYFRALIANKDNIGISSNVIISIVDKEDSENGLSHPELLVEHIIKYLDLAKYDCYSYTQLKDGIVEFLYEEEILSKTDYSAEELKSLIQDIWVDELNYSVFDEYKQSDCTPVTELLNRMADRITELNYYGCSCLVDSILDYIKSHQLTYDKDIDTVCLIVDRDKNSFIKNNCLNQYDSVVKSCIDNGFRLVVTNPCFEFWLLLHYEMDRFDKEKLLENGCLSNGVTYAVKCLRECCEGYKKSSYPAEDIVLLVDRAIVQEKRFCEDVAGLESNLGSNIGLLIEDMRKG